MIIPFISIIFPAINIPAILTWEYRYDIGSLFVERKDYAFGIGFPIIAACYALIIILEVTKHFVKFKKIKRQDSEYSASSNIIVSNADELKKFKDLLDAGIISQEEFDAKKKQLLGL